MLWMLKPRSANRARDGLYAGRRSTAPCSPRRWNRWQRLPACWRCATCPTRRDDAIGQPAAAGAGGGRPGDHHAAPAAAPEPAAPRGPAGRCRTTLRASPTTPPCACSCSPAAARPSAPASNLGELDESEGSPVTTRVSSSTPSTRCRRWPLRRSRALNGSVFGAPPTWRWPATSASRAGHGTAHAGGPAGPCTSTPAACRLCLALGHGGGQAAVPAGRRRWPPTSCCASAIWTRLVPARSADAEWMPSPPRWPAMRRWRCAA